MGMSARKGQSWSLRICCFGSNDRSGSVALVSWLGMKMDIFHTWLLWSVVVDNT